MEYELCTLYLYAVQDLISSFLIEIMMLLIDTEISMRKILKGGHIFV